MGRVVILFMTQTPSFSGICCWIIPLLFFIAFYPHLNQLLLHELDIVIDILSIDNKTERLKFRILLNNLNGQWPFLRKKISFLSYPSLCFKARFFTKPLIWKYYFYPQANETIITRKALHLPSFWKWGFLLWAPWPFKETGSILCRIALWGCFGTTAFTRKLGRKLFPKQSHDAIRHNTNLQWPTTFKYTHTFYPPGPGWSKVG